MLFAANEYRRVLATKCAHFQNDGHEPEIVLTHHLQHLPRPYKSYVTVRPYK